MIKGLKNIFGSRTRQFSAVSILAVLTIFNLPMTSYAATSQLYTAPSWAHVTTGKTLTVTIRINPTTPVDAVEATLKFNSTFIRYTSVDSTGSAFPVSLPTFSTGSSVKVTRGIFGPNTIQTDSLFARVNFQVLNKTGYTYITLVGNATFEGEYTNPTASGKAIRVFAP